MCMTLVYVLHKKCFHFVYVKAKRLYFPIKKKRTVIKQNKISLSECLFVFVDLIVNFLNSKIALQEMAEYTEKVESGPDARRRILNIAVSTVLIETGFDAADKMSLETLTEMLQCCKLIYH